MTPELSEVGKRRYRHARNRLHMTTREAKLYARDELYAAARAAGICPRCNERKSRPCLALCEECAEQSRAKYVADPRRWK